MSALLVLDFRGPELGVLRGRGAPLQGPELGRVVRPECTLTLLPRLRGGGSGRRAPRVVGGVRAMRVVRAVRVVRMAVRAALQRSELRKVRCAQGCLDVLRDARRHLFRHLRHGGLFLAHGCLLIGRLRQRATP